MRELWFSPVGLMNDFGEVARGKDIIWMEADQGSGRLWSVFEPIWKADPHLWDSISSEFSHRVIYDREETFISCWSKFDSGSLEDGRELYDDLSMWRSYGANGNGVALVFDPKVLFSHSFQRNGVTSTRVHYQSENEFVERCSRAFSNFTLAVLALSSEERELYQDTIVGCFAELCFFLSATHKHTGFQFENEWRFVWNRKPWSPESMTTQLRATISSNGLFQRLVMPFGMPERNDAEPFLEDALLEVMVGPCERSELKARGVLQLLSDHGFHNTHVSNSPIPFRG